MANYKNSSNTGELLVNHIDHRNDRIESRLLLNCLWSWFLTLFVIRGASTQTLKLPPLFALDKFTWGLSKKYKSMTKSFRKRSKRGRGFNCCRCWWWSADLSMPLVLTLPPPPPPSLSLLFQPDLYYWTCNIIVVCCFFSLLLLLGWDATKSMYGSLKMATQYDMMFFLLS